ncbi:hypothetical protein C8246_13580 [Paracidovorax avenae]|nr:hypothetical protein C8246_13580 [Paracidovorax avenae]AVS97672.1 hypothetical protein C8236_01735 [Paracidovorax avenae]AVT05340.1 hypothetical protein C8248_04625 [Paracidovorax avenae]AVT18856.1 hypothetical protein C7Y68_01715 [Paracidovorax avenae]
MGSIDRINAEPGHDAQGLVGSCSRRLRDQLGLRRRVFIIQRSPAPTANTRAAARSPWRRGRSGVAGGGAAGAQMGR